MDKRLFERFRREVGTMSVKQIRELADILQRIDDRKNALWRIDERGAEIKTCPQCGADKMTKWGTTRTGLLRLRCGKCFRTVSSASGTAAHRIRMIDKFAAVLRDMFGSTPQSCRDLAKEHGIDKMTVWRWRHRILEAMLAVGETDLSGIVEADEKFFRESRKGSREWVNHAKSPAKHPKPPRLRWEDYRKLRIKNAATGWQMPVLTITNRSGGRRADVLPKGSVPALLGRLKDHISNDAVLCSDGDTAYKQFATIHGIPHYAINAKKGPRVINKVFHIQTINSLHQRFERFMEPFRGPATKNLPKYTAWFIARSHREPDNATAAAWDRILAV